MMCFDSLAHRWSLLLSVHIVFFVSTKATAQWAGATRDTLTRDSFRDQNTVQSLAADISGALHVVWQRANQGGGWRIFYTKKPSGSSWAQPREVGDSTIQSFGPALAVDVGVGTALAAYQESSSSNGEIVVAKDSAGGWRRTRLTSNTTEDLAPTTAVDGLGKAHVAWIGRSASNDWKIFYATNVNTTWIVNQLTASNLGQFGSGAAPFVAVTSYGIAHIFYRGVDATNYHIHHAWNNLPGDTVWNYESIGTPNGEDFVARAVLDVNNTIHLLASGNDGFGFPPHAYYLRKPEAGSWTTPVRANPGGNGWGGSLAVDQYGKAHITWDETSGNIYTGNLYYATNKSGTWTDAPVLIDGQTYGGVMAVDGGGKGHVLVYNGATSQTQEIIAIHSNSVLTGVESRELLQPTKVILHQNYPNPFNPITEVRFLTMDYGLVQLKVCSVLGQEITTLVQSQLQPGNHTVTFNAADLSSGVYLSVLEVNGLRTAKRMLLLR